MLLWKDEQPSRKLAYTRATFEFLALLKNLQTVFETTISKLWSFDPRGDGINAKMDLNCLNWHFMYQCW